MKVTRVLGGAALVLALTAVSAMADAINLNRPFAPLAGSDSSEPTLQQILDANIVNDTINAITGQSNVGLWKSADGGSQSYLVALATGHPDGIFGIYSKTDPSLQFALIDRLSSISSFRTQRSFTLDIFGNLSISDIPVTSGFGQTFGFFWRDPVEPYFSYTEDSRNSGVGFGPGGNIKALTYQVANGTTFEGALGSVFTGASDGGNDWIMAFEDHQTNSIPRGDGDFNDAVFFITDLTPVPEPGTILLLGAGLLGLGFYGRRRMKG